MRKAWSLIFSALCVWSCSLIANEKFPKYFPVEYQSAQDYRTHPAGKASKPPQIDGVLDDEAWKNALVIKDFYLNSDGGKKLEKAKAQTEVLISYDDLNIYVGAKCYHPNAKNIKAPLKQVNHDKDVDWANAIEFFFDANGDRQSYYQVAADIGGNIFDCAYLREGKQDKDWTVNAVCKTSRSDGLYTIEMAMPLKDFGWRKPVEKRTWGINVARNDGGVAGEGATAWCGAFHAPQIFNRVTFSNKGNVNWSKLSLGEFVGGTNTFKGDLTNIDSKTQTALVDFLFRAPGMKPLRKVQEYNLAPRGKTQYLQTYSIPLEWLSKNQGAGDMWIELKILDKATKRPLRQNWFRQDIPSVSELELDRKRYHFNDLDGLGMARLNISKDLLDKVELQFSITPESSPESVVEKFGIKKPSDRGIAFSLPLGKLPPNAYELNMNVLVNGRKIDSQKCHFIKAAGRNIEQDYARVPITLQPADIEGGLWPVTTGVPFPRGALKSPENIRIVDEKGKEVNAEAKASARWTPNGYVKWALVDFTAKPDPKKNKTYFLEFGKKISRKKPDKKLKINETKENIEIDTGKIKFTVSKARFRFVDNAWLDLNKDGKCSADEKIICPSVKSGSYMTDNNGDVFMSGNIKPEKVELEEKGALRAVIKATGWQADEKGKKLGRYIVRVHAYAGQSFLRVFHTFIITEDSKKTRYKDIALETNLTKIDKSFLGMEKEAKVSGSLLVQDAWNHYFVEGGTKKIEGKCAPGWITALNGKGALTVALRDFWQNYPKELEADKNALTVHFWPKHNTPAKHNVDNTDRFNIHMLYFAHEGRELNFDIPKDYPKKFNKKNRREFYYIPNSMVTSNAIGVAKTHEMLYFFHAASEKERSVSNMVKAFQSGVPALADPKWICSTASIGCMPMQPKLKGQFDEIENAMEGLWDWERRAEKSTHDYGMWIFGDGHNEWKPDEKRWGVNRTWRNTHHGSPRVAWILYARSGDPKYLEYARRNTLKCIDIGFCHYSNPEFEAKSGGAQKVVGALNDYKGLVPWHAGGRLFDYNCMTDFMLYNYYFTGNRLPLDVMDEWTNSAVERFRKPRAGRPGAGVLAALIAAYQHNWDIRLLRLINAYAKCLISSQKEEGNFSDYWTEYAPWLNRLHEFSGSKESEECLRKWCDWFAETRIKKDGLDVWDKHGFHCWPLSYAYYLFGKPEYLQARLGTTKHLLSSVYRKPGSFYDGFWCTPVSVMGGYFLQEMPFFLYAMNSYGKDLTPFYPEKLTIESRDGQRIVMKEEADCNFYIHYVGWVNKKTVEYELKAPDGKICRSGKWEAAPRAYDVVIDVPKDGKTGEYTLELKSDGGIFSCELPMSSLSKEVLDTRHKKLTFVRRTRIFFFIPGNCLEADLKAGIYVNPNVVCVFDAKSQLVARAQWLGTDGIEKNIIVHPSPSQRAQIWSIWYGIGAAKRKTFQLPKNLPPYIAVSAERFFVAK